MTRGELAEVLNTAGGVDNFWQDPKRLRPARSAGSKGAWDDEGKAVVGDPSMPRDCLFIAMRLLTLPLLPL